jgi:hypothetical protein
MIQFHSDFRDRATFPAILNDRGLLGEACEIGSHQGQFTFEFMAGSRGEIGGWLGRKLWCVEPWSPSVLHYPGPPPESDGNRKRDKRIFMERMKNFMDRIGVLQMTSDEAAKQFKDGQLDFLHIDGDHCYEQVKLDLVNWWPKIKSGGILSGHDFICPGDPGWAPQVQRALFEFCEEQKIEKVFLVPENGFPWSFYLEKP